jgi:Exostosin family
VATVHMLTTADDQIAGYSGADFRRLSAAVSCDRFGKHRLIDSPQLADIILFVGSTYPDHRDVRSHPFLRRYRQKCFLFHSDDHVIPFLPGVYVNITKRWYSHRTVSGPYLQMIDWDFVPFVPSLADCEYLFCFVGSTRTHAVRQRLMSLKHPRAYLENTSEDVAKSEKKKTFFMVDYQPQAKTHYGNIIARSKFVLCPRGYACSTWRLFETMKAGRVPVIISDQWVAPEGPAWETFSIRVRQGEISRIPDLLERCEPEAELMGRRARTVWEEWFSKETVFHRIVEWCLSLNHRSRPSGISDFVPYIHLLRPFYVRHVLLPEIKRAGSHRLVGLRRFLADRFL